ncbi:MULTISPECIES: hypothetical protein [unclassified Cyanobium]|uniref:hypothetical protein n=1 Tax=unclassified Cyanobium TaxID=2627006 RepID=UPI0020CCD24F|nr:MULTISPECIES: hypothetical protein [unclassified Cyanobium]
MYHHNGLKVLEKGGALDGVRTLLLVVPQKRFAVAILTNRNLTALPEALRAALLQQAFGRPGEADLQPQIRAQARELEGLLLAVEPRPAQAQPPSRPWRAYTGTYVNDLFGSWTVAEQNGALVVLAGPARYRASLGPWNGDTLHRLWPGVLSAPVQVPVPERWRRPGERLRLPGLQLPARGALSGHCDHWIAAIPPCRHPSAAASCSRSPAWPWGQASGSSGSQAPPGAPPPWRPHPAAAPAWC